VTRPITPQEAEAKGANFPDAVIETWNTLIQECLVNRTSIVGQNEAILALMDAMGLEPGERLRVYGLGWLNIESAYRDAGWVVHYDRPGFNESFEAFFTFEMPR
jgi:hypothetical protein